MAGERKLKESVKDNQPGGGGGGGGGGERGNRRHVTPRDPLRVPPPPPPLRAEIEASSQHRVPRRSGDLDS
ncbi:hypothetical protein GUJ93_ZPchr0010g10439 [Zizania palustris]|uniref:Uncharacterized protein n=1 Tax=Zizania palustris TaxID=103762 RepID=A0A8J6BF57_ZIZPA|nr:hypothetical protein GUJ93_ZPchr0010g10439 [Zizania palustris]